MKTPQKTGIAILLALSLVSCAQQGSLKAGSATAKSLLQVIPASARGVIMVDVHRSLTAEAAQNALKDPKAKGKYDEFVKMVGIDPAKDVYLLALALSPAQPDGNRDGAAVVNLRYDKAALLARIKGIATDLKEEVYNGVTIYKGPGRPESKGMSPVGAFLDDSNIVIGSDKFVRAVIDVYQKRADSVGKSPEMKPLLKAVNMAANFWGAVAIPQEMVKMAAEKNPMLKNLVGLTGLTLSFDYAATNLVIEVQGLGGSKDQNKALADMLTGLKGMGGLAAAKQPLLGDILNKVEISSGPDNVKIYASLPQELLDKVQKMAQEKLGGMVQINPMAPQEEKKPEKKEGAEVKK